MPHHDTTICEKISYMQLLLHRLRMKNHMQGSLVTDRSRGQGRVLAMLKLQAEISCKDLAYLLGIRQQSLNELLGKLEKNGYISRKPSEADKRIMMISLTEKGRNANQEEAEPENFLSCLDDTEKSNLSAYLDKIIAALEEKSGLDQDEDLRSWMSTARERMGNDKFNYLMDACGGVHFHKKMADFHNRWSEMQEEDGRFGAMPCEEYFSHECGDSSDGGVAAKNDDDE